MCEVLAWGAAYLPGPLGELSRRFEPNSYQTLIGAAVTATANSPCAVLHNGRRSGLDDLPVGSRRDPHTLHDERSSVIYVRGVVRALVFGCSVPVGAFVREQSMVSIVVLGLLSLNAALRLMLFGNKLFNFFDRPHSVRSCLRDSIEHCVA